MAIPSLEWSEPLNSPDTVADGHILRNDLGMKFQDIADCLNINHSSVIYHCNTLQGYLDNKDTAKTYNITRDFNPEWNKNTKPTSALVKYRACFDNEILNSGINNNISTVQNTVKTTSKNSLGLSI